MNILIVEDHPLLRETLDSVAREVFEGASVATAGTFAEALEKARAAKGLDMVLLDLGLPDCSGIEALKRLRRANTGASVVVFSEVDEPSSVVAAIESGARGFLPKSLTRPVISAALRLIAAGGIYVPPQAMEARREYPPRRINSLTTRQLDVVRLIAKGLTNREIGEKLRIAQDTVKQHARAAYAALGVSSRTQAMTAVTRRGIRFD
jgi:DNA-binding NarL/FixJ family response regulator